MSDATHEAKNTRGVVDPGEIDRRSRWVRGLPIGLASVLGLTRCGRPAS